MQIYADNAATSFPKPDCVYNDILNYMRNIGSNPGRGASTSSLKGNKVIFQCRNALCDFFNFPDTKNVIFTSNITMSLNILIKGIVKPGWHVITSSMDHNSTLRTLNELKSKGIIELDIIQCNKLGEIDIDDFQSKIKHNTKLVTLSHGSNIIGTIQPLEKIGQICKGSNIFFIIDTAQTAGVLDLNFQKLNCNALAFTGHKSLLGPQGIGGFIIDDEMNDICSPLIVGGTGSVSSDIIQPNFLPDKFESGTINAPGIAGLLSGITFIQNEGLSTIKDHEDYLTQKFIDGILNISTMKVYGHLNTENRTSTISVNSSKIDNSELGFILDSQYNIITRTGLHCAPLAHKTIGTYPNGTLRFSFGYFNDDKDIDYILCSINSSIKKL
ncbi:MULTISPECIES: aminotransferase class V-fold PLP-dependent enzyme [unclassified Clostridium]|uniref:aminotransferase class V-fold PLP-dependent enzyme n=1 Tax=unclassified Clostridium TaxID=2614128 RepID=UPI003217D8F1